MTRLVLDDAEKSWKKLGLCPTCGGTGELTGPDTYCRDCGGWGSWSAYEKTIRYGREATPLKKQQQPKA